MAKWSTERSKLSGINQRGMCKQIGSSNDLIKLLSFLALIACMLSQDFRDGTIAIAVL